MIQATGDYDGAIELKKKYAVSSESMKILIENSDSDYSTISKK